MTAERTSFIYVTYIASTPEKVFEAITRPEIASRYWGHENVSDWQPGSGWQHIRANDERTVELVGQVVEISPPSHLVITWANASQADDPEAYSRVTFAIEEYDEMIRLTVTQDLEAAVTQQPFDRCSSGRFGEVAKLRESAPDLVHHF
jgi:uncharacterized protein YndB with AHSA1/START domain